MIVGFVHYDGEGGLELSIMVEKLGGLDLSILWDKREGELNILWLNSQIKPLCFK